MSSFHPAIARGGILTEFPHPILVFRVRDSWDFQMLKGPLRDGEEVGGHSRQGVDVVIEGQIGQHSGTLKLSEPEMFETLNTLRDLLNVNSEQSEYSLVIFADNVAGIFRHFRRCTTTRFEFDLSSQYLYSFAATIHAADPKLYSESLPA